jgi:thiol-disulfide isomerase/thioredoxin
MNAAGGKNMGGNPDGLHSLAKYSKLPVERIKYLADADEENVRAIGRGILFLMAFWSGPSVKAFAKLTEVVASLPAHDLELVVVDVDGSFPLYELPEFKGQISGSGETAWVRDGRIVTTSGRGLNVECFKPNTLALLSMP